MNQSISQSWARTSNQSQRVE